MYDYSMNILEQIKNLTLNQKIKQLFIAGFEGENPDNCEIFQKLLKEGLGGVIFFTQNIKSKNQFKQIIDSIKEKALVPPFLSIDQEGGRVERTEQIHNGKKYLSARFAAEKGIDFLESQTIEMLNELKNYGINMNFAPVLDVNTNDANPIIGERAYATSTDDVIKYSQVIIDKHNELKIIPVGKHFPGHGASSVDSHVCMPIIDISKEELENIHVKPFKESIKKGLDAIMVAHVHYPCFDKEIIPASLSKNVVQKYLIEELNFQGLIISDDMIMGAVQGYSPIEACISALNAGVNMFIFRHSDEKVLNLIERIEDAVKAQKLSEATIDNCLKRILNLKNSIIK